MEDRLSFRGRLEGRNDASLYAVFDGHGGALASEFCAQELPRYVVGSEEGWEVATKAALRDAFMKTDAAFVKATEGTNRLDGTTALVALIRGTQLFVANAGDSRAILVQRGARVVPLSRDHKPSLPDELQRITEMGGKVIFWGRWRVEGILAVSRAIGDMHLKPYVTPEPEVTEWEVAEDDLFLILASDGIWDVLSNEMVAAFVVNHSHDVKLAAKRLCREASLNGSMDNLCAVVIDLREIRRRRGNSIDRLS